MKKKPNHCFECETTEDIIYRERYDVWFCRKCQKNIEGLKER